ncbi:hypothetical protein CC78DRAFT_531581 [Lojkania enalia]|uniref:Uncharacterized protein n=1 Tax=Lojkania enalia TaxID=147567 RepID=A0A9P4N7H2_9PLEO|nr:hypothetical protein CC78DRAFT_531581 [Didymosphaeria enalia]
MQEPYRDSPVSSRASSPSTSGRASPSKPLPSLPVASLAPTPSTSSPGEPYRDDPLSDASNSNITAPQPHRSRAARNHPHRRFCFPPYTDEVFDSDDDVPLAHLYPYPTEAPPSYASAVVQSYRDTLIAHIPPNDPRILDEEVGIERDEPDDIRFSVERVLAKIIVALALVIITILLVWQVLAMKGML